MHASLVIFLCVALALLLVVEAADSGEKSKQTKTKKKRSRVNPAKIALESWAQSLTEKDYNYTEWRIMYHSRSTVDFFNGYAKKLSNLFKENNAKVNFAMIGMELYLNSLQFSSEMKRASHSALVTTLCSLR
jgi:hypothetical protein